MRKETDSIYKIAFTSIQPLFFSYFEFKNIAIRLQLQRRVYYLVTTYNKQLKIFFYFGGVSQGKNIVNDFCLTTSVDIQMDI